MDGDDKILLKIHRQFSKDEAVNELIAQIKKLKFEIGVLKSDKAELEDKVSRFSKERTRLKEYKEAKKWRDMYLQIKLAKSEL